MTNFMKLSDEEFKNLNQTSSSIVNAMESSMDTPTSYNYRLYKDRCQELSISPPIFVRSSGFQRKYSNEQLFSENFEAKTNGQELKRRLIRDFNWEDGCMNELCPSPSAIWAGKKLTIQLDHINGNNRDNRIENLRFLCPNCHSQTETFGGKATAVSKTQKKYFCTCGKEKSRYSASCRSCSSYAGRGRTKIVWPPLEDLLFMIESTSVYRVGKDLGVSDNAIRKHILKNYGIKV